jgi:hypothetical protein
LRNSSLVGKDFAVRGRFKVYFLEFRVDSEKRVSISRASAVKKGVGMNFGVGSKRASSGRESGSLKF